jgi:hypothetical protein
LWPFARSFFKIRILFSRSLFFLSANAPNLDYMTGALVFHLFDMYTFHSFLFPEFISSANLSIHTKKAKFSEYPSHSYGLC